MSEHPGFIDHIDHSAPSSGGVAGLEAARRLVPELRARSAEAEVKQGLPFEVASAMADAGYFLMGAPAEVGGGEIDYVSQFRIMEELARGDGSAGWTILVHTAAAYLAKYLTLEGAQELFASPHTIIAGSPGPSGKAVRVPGGFRVTGEWNFASNSNHATHFIGGFRLVEDLSEEVAPFRPESGAAPGSMPEIRTAYYPAHDVQVIAGSWDTIGLRGTHSGSFAVEDVFVPEQLTMPMARMAASDVPTLTIDAPVGAGGHSMVSIGIARHALEAYYELASAKANVFAGAIKERPIHQYEIARAESVLRAARAWQYEVLYDAVGTWEANGKARTPGQRMVGALNNTYCYDAAKQCLDVVFRLAASDAIRKSNDIEKCYRDVLTAGAHVGTQWQNYQTIGANLIGLDVNFGVGAF